MAIAAVFTPRSMTQFEYDIIIRRLEAAGAGTPPGRLYHVCYGTADQLRVLDVWESAAALESFMVTLAPIIQQVGVDTPPPRTIPTHNIIEKAVPAHDNVAIVRDINAAFNERDINRCMQHYADDVEWVDAPLASVVRGRHAVRQWIEGWITAFEDGQAERVRVFGQGPFVTVEFSGCGTHSGPLHTPAGEIPATGRRVDVPFCQVLELRDGLVVFGTNYYDAATLLGQLGIAGPLGRAPGGMPVPARG